MTYFKMQLKTRLFGYLVFVLICAISYGLTNKGVLNAQESFIKIDYPKSNTKLRGRITVKGSHNYASSEHLWIVLSDGFGYYLQSPAVELYKDEWIHENVILGGGIKSIIIVWVDEEGHKEFLEKVKNFEFGQFKKLPKNSKKVDVVKVRN